ncbi:hypothetical protein THRCLA_05605 [Thraustotheca clavata]|uniref:SCP2 domain-containing protein n=1 Tax=Thraustotheca clavata TaxID=74557 RepID=A0A1V9ZVI4_9STRA|nr:hypothetical protein THRCLA_05605 [Thraustotheca clavata]
MSNAAEVFTVMAAAVADAGEALVKKVNGSIKFDVKGAGMWLINLKSAPGSVTASNATDKADLTITISEADFVDLINEKLNPQAAFMKGKLKIKGNMGLAMKLSAVTAATKAYLAKKKTAGASAPAAAPAASGLKSAALFAGIGEAVKTQGPQLVSKVKGTIQFNIAPGGAWYLDLKNGSGLLETGTKPADLTINVSDDDFMAIADGKLNAQQAFMKGKLKVKGNMGLAMKLNVVIDAAKPKSKL